MRCVNRIDHVDGVDGEWKWLREREWGMGNCAHLSILGIAESWNLSIVKLSGQLVSKAVFFP